MKTKKMKAIAMLAVVLLFAQSFGNTIALGNYVQTSSPNYLRKATTSATCGVVGIGAIVAVVGVGLQLVEAAYNFGYFLGSHIGQAQLHYNQVQYDQDDFSEFDS